nr:SymE family type I addiction module toxin [Pectobacterium brasiliense]
MHITGHWFEELGFNTGQSVIVEHCKLVIETGLRF